MRSCEGGRGRGETCMPCRDPDEVLRVGCTRTARWTAGTAPRFGVNTCEHHANSANTLQHDIVSGVDPRLQTKRRWHCGATGQGLHAPPACPFAKRWLVDPDHTERRGFAGVAHGKTAVSWFKKLPFLLPVIT